MQDGDGASTSKMPSIREQLTVAYENLVAQTKATRDLRLLKGNNNKLTCLTVHINLPIHLYPQKNTYL